MNFLYLFLDEIKQRFKGIAYFEIDKHAEDDKKGEREEDLGDQGSRSLSSCWKICKK